MAKAVALIASALCVLALAGLAQSTDYDFYVEGEVYCDACRVSFWAIGDRIPRAKLELKCRSRENGTVTYTGNEETDDGGFYNFHLKEDHEEDICDLTVLSSTDPNCNEFNSDISTTRVNLARNDGTQTMSRYANPIGFARKEALPECTKKLDEMGFVPLV